MLYQAYQAHSDMTAPMRLAARATLDWAQKVNGFNIAADTATYRRVSAALELISRAELTHHRPPFGIDSVRVGNREVAVTEEVALDLPFGKLIRFTKDVDVAQPRVLVAAPLSGHFATLLRGTVQTLLRDHEVYITDWANARDVPRSAGVFGFDDYVAYLIRFLEEIGPGAHLLAVCQPCVQALVAASVMAQNQHISQPKSLTLMAGPVDTRINPTEVNKLATSHPYEWFESKLITTVPWRYPGGGRSVYPGFLQVIAFMSMNIERHVKQHQRLYDHLAKGETEKAEAIKTFYDEYFAVLDLSAEFYLETIDRVFQRALLAKGELTYRGEPVTPSAMRRTALLTVEGERDDICAVGQTSVAHELCSSLRPHLKRHHLQADVGHYGVFNGRRWESQIYPIIRNMILAVE